MDRRLLCVEGRRREAEEELLRLSFAGAAGSRNVAGVVEMGITIDFIH